MWGRVFQVLSADADNEYAMIDATIVHAHQHSAGVRNGGGDDQTLGHSRGGLRTKIHATMDALGNSTSFALTGGQASDLVGADELVPRIAAATVIADKGYDAEARVLGRLREAGKTPVVFTRKRVVAMASNLRPNDPAHRGDARRSAAATAAFGREQQPASD